MAVTNIKSRPIFIWVPPSSATDYKIEVVRHDGTIDDITGLIANCTVNNMVLNEGVGDFSFDIFDPNETYAYNWTGNETFNYYKSYSTDLTLKFVGKVEKVDKKRGTITVTGRAEFVSVLSTYVTYSANSKECSEIITELFNQYFPSYDTSSITATTISTTVDWNEKSFSDCVTEICKICGYDCRIEPGLVVKFFETGSSQITTDAAIHDYNILSISDFADDYTVVRNKIKVYGAVEKEVQVVYTATDTTSIADIGERGEVIQDDSITTREQCIAYAEALLNEKKLPQQVGSIEVLLLSDLFPGDSIQCSSPSDNLQPAFYSVKSFTDNIDNMAGTYTTDIEISNSPDSVSNIIKNNILKTQNITNTSVNKFGLDYSFNNLFSQSLGTLSNAVISNGVLYPTSVGGSWISVIQQEDSNINQVYPIITGETLNGVTIEITANGTNYQTCSNKTLKTLSTAKGSGLQVKITFNDINSQLQSCGILYNKD